MRKKRTRKAPNFEARLENSLLRLIPELPNFVRKLEIQAKQFDGSEPKTFTRKMENEANRFVETLKGRERQISRLLMFLLRRLALKIWAKKFTLTAAALTETLASTDPRYIQLLQLMDEIDRQIPLASIVVSQCYADPKNSFDARSLALHALTRAKEASGESRAYLARDAFAKVFELVYQPYINVMWVLSYFRIGKVPPADPPAAGAMLNLIKQRLPDYPGLLDPDAARIRNSATHDRPDPISDYGVLRFKGANRKVNVITVEALIARAESMFLMSARTVQLVGQLYLYRMFLKPGLLEMVTNCMRLELAGDAKKLCEAEEKARAYGDSLIQPLQIFLEQGKL